MLQYLPVTATKDEPLGAGAVVIRCDVASCHVVSWLRAEPQLRLRPDPHDVAQFALGRFEALGWLVTERSHVCPDHAAKQRQAEADLRALRRERDRAIDREVRRHYALELDRLRRHYALELAGRLLPGLGLSGHQAAVQRTYERLCWETRPHVALDPPVTGVLTVDGPITPRPTPASRADPRLSTVARPHKAHRDIASAYACDTCNPRPVPDPYAARRKTAAQGMARPSHCTRPAGLHPGYVSGSASVSGTLHQ